MKKLKEFLIKIKFKIQSHFPVSLQKHEELVLNMSLILQGMTTAIQHNTQMITGLMQKGIEKEKKKEKKEDKDDVMYK